MKSSAKVVRLVETCPGCKSRSDCGTGTLPSTYRVPRHRVLMEGRGPPVDSARLQAAPQLLACVIEYAWAHRTHDLMEVVDPSHWPDTESQPMSLADPMRLRVASAHMYCIVKNRDLDHFERVIRFMEATHRLLPGLVTPLKHMKIVFGLKTLVIMRMLRDGRLVDTVCKVVTFFPSELPQYQDQCNQYEMLIMRKNHLDFRTLAQALAVDKDKLNDYMMKHMEEHYGEHYAQKVEDRLLQYLHKLEAVLKEDTYIDKILNKSSPVTKEEKLLLELVTCDSIIIATTLKNLLHSDFPFSREAVISSENEETDIENSQLSKSLYSSKGDPKPVVGKSLPEVFRGRGEPAQELPIDSPEVGTSRNKGMEETCHRGRQPATSPHFCSKHQRWVKSILQECHDEYSEDLLLQANLSLSPSLFHSSSSTSSSQGLHPTPPDQSPPFQTTEQATSEDEYSSGSASSTLHKEAFPQPPLTRDVLLPALLSPVVRLMTRSCSSVKLANDFIVSSEKELPTCSHCHISTNKDSIFNLPEQHFTRPFRKHRQTCTNTRHLKMDGFTVNPLDEQTKQVQTTFSMNCQPSFSCCTTRDGSLSASQSVRSVCIANVISSSTKLSNQAVPQNSTMCHRETQSISSAPVQTLHSTAVASCATNTDHLIIRHDSKVPRQSTLLQPHVNVTRLSSHECYRITKRRCDPEAQGRRLEGEEDTDSSFDPNSLYSSHSSSSDSEEMTIDDPDYKPCIKKKRLLLEYEAARSLKRV